MYELITDKQTKMEKALEYGYYSTTMNLAPAYDYKGNNTCLFSGKCKPTCLRYTGRNRLVIDVRERKTELYYDDKEEFYHLLDSDLEQQVVRADNLDCLTTFRPNCLSDIRFERDKECLELMDSYDIQWIDYTKWPSLYRCNLPQNYHLTYSLNEKSTKQVVEGYFERGFNVSVVFYGEDLPESYSWEGLELPVCDGDKNDLRHLDPREHWVGLRYKLPIINGKAFRPKKSNGFVVVH